MALSKFEQMFIDTLRKDGLLEEFLSKQPEGYLKQLSEENERRVAEQAAREKAERERMLARMHTKNPYQSHLLNRELLMLLADRGVQIKYAAHALKDIALVGMLLPNTWEIQNKEAHATDLWGHDRKMISDVAKSFSEAGIPIHPEVNFTLYNLLPPISSDFLMSTHPDANKMGFKFPKTDAVLISSIPKRGAPPDHPDYEVNRGFSVLTSDQLISMRNNSIYTSVSGFNYDPNVWAQAAFNLGAKFIAVRGGTGDEVSTNHLKDHESSSLLIDTKSGRGLGYVARKSALPEYTAHVNQNTPLGAAIQCALG